MWQIILTIIFYLAGGLTIINDRLDTIHAGALRTCFYYKQGKLSQYCLYRWNLLLRAVSRDQHAISFQVLPCSSSTCAFAWLTALVTVSRNGFLRHLFFVLYVYANALWLPFYHARSGCISYCIPLFSPDAPVHTADALPDALGGISFAIPLVLPYVQDYIAFANCAPHLCAPDYIVFTARAFFLDVLEHTFCAALLSLSYEYRSIA